MERSKKDSRYRNLQGRGQLWSNVRINKHKRCGRAMWKDHHKGQLLIFFLFPLRHDFRLVKYPAHKGIDCRLSIQIDLYHNVALLNIYSTFFIHEVKKWFLLDRKRSIIINPLIKEVGHELSKAAKIWIDFHQTHSKKKVTVQKHISILDRCQNPLIYIHICLKFSGWVYILIAPSFCPHRLLSRDP
jgi:hypothetical protein